MAKKALWAEDLQRYALIMNEPAPSKCKKLGKQVKNLDIAAWGRCKEEIVYHANLAKFSQNKKTVLSAQHRRVYWEKFSYAFARN